ncbi:hypothetical protein [Turicimonas sp. TL08]
MTRTQFLKDNPEKSASDFPYVVVRTNGVNHPGLKARGLQKSG